MQPWNHEILCSISSRLSYLLHWLATLSCPSCHKYGAKTPAWSFGRAKWGDGILLFAVTLSNQPLILLALRPLFVRLRSFLIRAISIWLYVKYVVDYRESLLTTERKRAFWREGWVAERLCSRLQICTMSVRIRSQPPKRIPADANHPYSPCVIFYIA